MAPPPIDWTRVKIAPGAALATLDTYEALAATPRPRDLYVLWHMNAAGNALIARLVAGALGDKGN